MQEGSLSGRAGLVTGAAYGIGRSSAQKLAAAGASVAVVDVDVDRARETVELIEQEGGTAVTVNADISDEAQVQRMVRDTLSAFGRLDFAHNNAGIAPATGTTVECSQGDYEKVLAVNLTGTFLCMKHEIRHMTDVGSGAIINTSSAVGVLGFPNQPAYVASKHGIIGATRAAALECASEGVRVNTVIPGTVLTGLTEHGLTQGMFTMEGLASLSPMKKVAYPEDIARAVVWLAGDDAGFVTGAAIPVDGGATAGLASFWA